MSHMPAVRKLLARPATHDVVKDQCMYGLHDPVSGDLSHKPFRINDLRAACSGAHFHEPVSGKVKYNSTWMSHSEIAGAYHIELSC